MFGISIYKILGILIAVGLLVGYYMHTQSKLESLNQSIAKKEFALKSAAATIEKTKEDLKRQTEVAQKAFSDYEAARKEVDNLRNKFEKKGGIEKRAQNNPSDIENRINKATKRVLNCVEDVINKEQGNGC